MVGHSDDPIPPSGLPRSIIAKAKRRYDSRTLEDRIAPALHALLMWQKVVGIATTHKGVHFLINGYSLEV
jgi:hypothetical protein